MLGAVRDVPASRRRHKSLRPPLGKCDNISIPYKIIGMDKC